MKKTVVLMGLLVLAGCDGLVPDATTEPGKEESVTPEAEASAPKEAAGPDIATEAEAVMRKVLDDWVFGEANYKSGANADIDFGDINYNIGNPLSSYEIIAIKKVDTDEVRVAVRLVLPTRGGVAEIKKSVSYTVLKIEDPKKMEIFGKWRIGPTGEN